MNHIQSVETFDVRGPTAELHEDVESPEKEVESLTDEELARMFTIQGETAAVEELIRRYSDKVMGLAMRITRDEAEAEEVLQNVFLTVLRKLHTFRHEAKFSSWLYRVTLNAAYMHMGSKNRRAEKETSLDDYSPYGPNGRLEGVAENEWSNIPENVLLSREGMEKIEEAIGELPLKYRVVFILADIEGLTDREVADTLGLTLSATKSRKRRARLFLRDKLSRQLRPLGAQA